MLENYSPCQNRSIAECLEIKIVSAVNQICRFASTMKKEIQRPGASDPKRMPKAKHWGLGTKQGGFGNYSVIEKMISR